MTCPTKWDGLALPLAGGQVLLSQRAAMKVAIAITAAEKYARERNGGGASVLRELHEVLEVIKVACRLPDPPPGMSAGGHADVPVVADLPPSLSMELISTNEASTVLLLSDRHVRRLARSGALGPLEGTPRSFRLHRGFVDAYHQTRTRKEPA